MAFINPELAPGGVGWAKSLQQDADFAKLSPASQQVILKYLAQLKGDAASRTAFTTAVQQDPALQTAMNEAKQVGVLNHPMSGLNKALAAGLGVAVGGAFILPLLAGGAAASAPAAGGGVGVGETGATVGLGSLSAPIVNKGASSIWRSLAPTLIGAGANVAGNVVAARSNSAAAKTQAEATDKELALQREMFEKQLAQEAEARALEQKRYDTSRADSSPYRQTGTSALSKLDELMGFGPLDLSAWNTAQQSGYGAPPSASGTLDNPTSTDAARTAQMQAEGTTRAQIAPQNTLGQIAPPPTPATAQAQTQSGYVAMRAPTGKSIMVPPDRVQEAQSRGAVPLGAA